MYCGDETGSFIGDIGSHVSRFGYGGYDSPSYVVPSYVATFNENDNNIATATTISDPNNNSNTDNVAIKKRKVAGSTNNRMKYAIPTSCYNYRYSDADYCNFRSPLRSVAVPNHPNDTNSSTTNNDTIQSSSTPIIDPNLYLQQGDTITDWDAFEYMWQSSLDTLRVQDKYKHTVGGSVDDTTTSAAAGGVISSTIRSNTISAAEGNCVHPLLVVTPGCTYKVSSGNGAASMAAVNRNEMIRITEIMMEQFQAPCIFVAPSAMLSSFCYGRSTALIVDIGASGTRVTPVVDGIVLKQSQRRSGRGGDYLSNVQWYAMNHMMHNTNQQSEQIVLRPRYQLSSAWRNNSNTTISTTKRTGLFHRWAMNDLMYEFRTSEHVQLHPQGSWNDNGTDTTMQRPSLFRTSSTAKQQPGVTENDESSSKFYELPDGTLVDLSSDWGNDLCNIPELLFMDELPFRKDDTSSILNEHHTLSNLPIHQLIKESLSSVGDIDARKELALSIIVTGGCSLLGKNRQPQPGTTTTNTFEQRLSHELSYNTISSAFKCKVHTSKDDVERTCSAWVGGSILSSLGSFQQLWLSRTEYNEYGPTLGIQRFP